MKILFLDDERVRHDLFDEENGQQEVWHAYSFDQFRYAVFRAKRFDVISFDHDLGQPETGYDVAKWFMETVAREFWPRTFVVHSWNPDGAKRIVDVLRDAGAQVTRAPFASRE